MAHSNAVMPDGWKPKHFLIDVDGVMTTGQFFYTKDGKVMKIFGPDDHDALLLLKPYMEIRFVTGDRRGFEISKRRIVDDMKFPLDLISTIDRIDWIRSQWKPEDVVYMGDGVMDVRVFSAVGYSICPGDGFYLARDKAGFVTTHPGGNRAVADACIHLLQKFFGPYDLLEGPKSMKGGEWGV